MSRRRSTTATSSGTFVETVIDIDTAAPGTPISPDLFGLFSRSSPGSGGHPVVRVVHFWLEPPWQSHRWSWVPSVVEKPGMSRQRPEAGLR